MRDQLIALAYVPVLIVWGIWHRAFGDDYDEEIHLRRKYPDLFVTDWHDGTDN